VPLTNASRIELAGSWALLGLARGFLHPFSKEKPTHEHKDSVEYEQAN
jgi:hypothetical protein